MNRNFNKKERLIYNEYANRKKKSLMICINCCLSVDTLFVVYSGQHIRLTVCPNCQNVVDKYVEQDPVLLFIDLLLLKPGAYRHLAFNKLEVHLSKYPEYDSVSKYSKLREKWLAAIRNLHIWYNKYNQLIRLWIFIITFDVYLSWINDEKRYQKFFHEGTNPARLVLHAFFDGSPILQYVFFCSSIVLELLFLSYGFQFALIKKWGWGAELKFAKDIISYTIILSYGAKIFPILALIWPYDALLSTVIIKFIANFYIIESLRIVTRIGYLQIISLFCVISIFQYIFGKFILVLMLFGCNWSAILHYVRFECEILLKTLMLQA